MVAVPTHRLSGEVEQFRRHGFAYVPDLIAGDAVESLRVIYDEVLDGKVDCGENDRMLGGVTRQVMHPRSHHPALGDHPVFEAARTACGELLGCDDTRFGFDMMIFKPPGHAKTTPWHQDFAYFQQPFTPAGAQPVNVGVQVWVAVDEADVENGCMHFVPDIQAQPLLAHHIASGDPDYEGRLLAIVDPENDLDLASAVACPLPAGGATFHTDGTPHFTPANRSADRPRRAYIMNFFDPSKLNQ